MSSVVVGYCFAETGLFGQM